MRYLFSCVIPWPMLQLSLGGMVTYYCISFEEALRRAKIAGKQPGCYYGGITLRSGKKGFAVYREGKVVEQYSVINKNAHQSER